MYKRFQRPQGRTAQHSAQHSAQYSVRHNNDPAQHQLSAPVHAFQQPTGPFIPFPKESVFSQLIEPLQRAVRHEGYETPTPIQEQSIPVLLKGRDILGCAQTGTGKTAAFLLPILQHLHDLKRMPGRGRPRVIVMAPTRELVMQIDESISSYGRYMPVTHTFIFGGVGQGPQVLALNRGMDIVVATPGRLLDLMQQGYVKLDTIEIFVLDEADRMLDMGFIHDIKKIIVTLPKARQSLFFSATLEPAVLQLARTMVIDPVHISITPDQPTVEKIQQKVMFVERDDKDALLVELLRDPKINKVIVFTQMKHVANKVAQKLNQSGIRADAIHGNKSQTARIQALGGFKEGKVRVLVATDIAARGIDVENITHIINYDLPTEPETYIHRIGRTARAGAEGDAVSFCSSEERGLLYDIERLIKQHIAVDSHHRFHSEAARNASEHNRPVYGQRGQQSRGPRQSHGGPRQAHSFGAHRPGQHAHPQRRR